MTVRFRFSRSLAAVLAGLSRALLVAGTGAIALYVWSQADLWLYQNMQRRHLLEAPTLSDAPSNVSAGAKPESSTAVATSRRRVGSGTPLMRWMEPDPHVIGVIEIPRLGIDALIREGTDDKTLRRSVGHVSGTALPGSKSGNAVLAAHRDTLFRSLRHIERGDVIYIRRRGEAQPAGYRVQSISIVGAGATQVMEPGPDATLTLVTCYPFDFAGHATRRFVVQAMLYTGAR